MKWLLLEPTGVIGRSTSRSADLRHFPPAFVVAVVAVVAVRPDAATGQHPSGRYSTHTGNDCTRSSAFFRGVDRRYRQGVVLRHLQ